MVSVFSVINRCSVHKLNVIKWCSVNIMFRCKFVM